MMKDKIILIVISFTLLAVLASPYIFVKTTQGEPIYELIATEESPNGECTAYAYRVNESALDAYSVEVYVECADNKRCVYDAYDEAEVDMCWIDSGTLVVNGTHVEVHN